MKKVSLFVLVALTFALVTNFTVAQASASPDPDAGRVGLVVAYTPDESITIVDRNGSQFTFTLAPDLKIVPKHRVDLLNVGSFVTVISPSSVGALPVPGSVGVATGIVIHPQVPPGFPIPVFTATPLPTETVPVTETPTAVVTETPAFTETPTAVLTETPTAPVTETVTATETALAPATETVTVTPTATVPGTGNTAINPQVTQSFVEWLASLFRQILTSNG